MPKRTPSQTKPQRKYRNTVCHFKGMRFDSKKELQRYKDLCVLESAGKIKNLKRQVKFPLEMEGEPICTRDKNGRRRRLSWTADFTYLEDDANYIVEDVKGYDTPVSRIKRAVVEALYQVEIRIT